MKTRFRHLLSVSLAFVAIAVMANLAIAQSGSMQYSPNAQPALSLAQQMQRVATNSQTQVGLEGYCPVCIIKLKKWVASSQMMAKNQIGIRDQVACAGRKFGVTPISAPDELGLAISTRQAKVYVVGDAHSRWPEIYKGRFDGTLAVQGEVINAAGKVTWIKPSSLIAL